MDAKTLKALKGSIEKWKKIERSTRCLDKGASNCSLCKVFLDCDSNEGCPIYNRTKGWACMDTPYDEWDSHQKEKHSQFKTQHRHKNCPTCLELATKEREFLESLLPKDNA